MKHEDAKALAERLAESIFTAGNGRKATRRIATVLQIFAKGDYISDDFWDEALADMSEFRSLIDSGAMQKVVEK